MLRSSRISSVALVMVAVLSFAPMGCGSGGSGGSGDSSGTLKAQPKRANGLSARAATDANYNTAINAVLDAMVTVVNDTSEVRFPADIPVFFSGCGTLNALWLPPVGAATTIHAILPQAGSPANTDFAAVFGTDAALPAILMCHELAEKALTFFEGQTGGDLQQAAVLAAVFSIQILFHEVGHGLLDRHAANIDFTALGDPNTGLVFPVGNTCAQAGCNTAREDFADWMAGLAWVSELEDEFVNDPGNANAFLGAYLIAIAGWPGIIGVGGDPAHGFTVGRQINFLCYAYGGLQQLRTLDNNTAGTPIAATIQGQGVDPNTCMATYDRNRAAIVANLGFAFRS